MWHYWSRTLGAVYVETPDPAVNFLANGWLLYQTLACRMWARSGFLSVGRRVRLPRSVAGCDGAWCMPSRGLLREHLLRAAAHQFREGDVQHWWHPPVGRGVRTHFSDDYLWLPLRDLPLRQRDRRHRRARRARAVPRAPRRCEPDEEAYYDLPQVSDDVGTLYEHCVRAIDNGLRFGAHGLPLMGCGDWNDGMNLVGAARQRRERLAGVLPYDVLTQFAELARRRGDAAFADKCTLEAGRLRDNIEEHGWDGEWYRRAYFDDGTPLGSAANPECQIDSLSQSWSVLSGAGDARAVAHGDGQRRPPPRPPRRPADPAPRSAVRQVGAEPRLHQGLRPRRARERRPVHPRGHLDGHGLRRARAIHARAWELFALINPVTHGATPEAIATYRVEPYVVAADVYAVPPHTGRGGWTWYTGSAGWMYRLIIESLLGLRLDVDKLRFAPCLPADWSSFKIHYRYRETFYHITVRKPVQAAP